VRSQAKAPFAASIEGGGRQRRAVSLVGLVVAIAALFAIGAAPALALQAGSIYRISDTFGSIGTGPGEFKDPTHVATEPGSRNVLVADPGNGRVQVFAADGTLLTSLAPNALTTPVGIAVDQGSGAIYVSDAGAEEILKFSSDGAPTPTYTQDLAFASPTQGSGSGEVGSFASALAVDPISHDLLVADRGNGRVDRFTAAGVTVPSFSGVASETGTFTVLRDIAVGPDGEIVVIDATGEEPWLGGSTSQVKRFTATGAADGELAASETPTAVAVDPLSGHIAVSGKSFVFEGRTLFLFAADGTELGTVSLVPGLGGQEDEGEVRGLAFAGEGASARVFALYGFNRYGGQDELYGAPGVEILTGKAVPAAEFGTASDVTPFAAHVAGTVAPGFDPAKAFFEYSFDGSSWEKTAEQVVAASPPGPGQVTIEADLTGLRPSSTYSVRLVALNEDLGSPSSPGTFRTGDTPPDTHTGSATDIGVSGAVLNGTVNPEGGQSIYHFEYGLTTAYGSRIPQGIEAVAGNGRSPRIFSRTIEGLQPGTTYHYRLVAQNSAGLVDGGDRTFTTLAAGAIAQRGYEQVTPVDKLGGVVDNRVGYQAMADGSGFSYVSRPASAGLEGSPWMARSMSVRTGTAWNGGIGLNPPLGVRPNYVMQTTLGLSADFTHTFVATDRKLSPDAEEGATNLYVHDIESGAYTLVASTTDPSAFPFFTSLQTANKFIAGSSDYDWVVFGSPPLLPGVTGTALYRWSETGGLELESTLPGGSAPTTNVALSSPTGAVRSISSDGSRDYFTLRNGSEDGVYLREDGQVRAVSVSHVPGDPATAQPAQFLGAGKDGRYAFLFSYGPRLTSDAPGLPGDIYRYDAASDELEYLGATAGPGATPEERASFGVSDDGGTLYFDGPDGMSVWRNGSLRHIADYFFGLGAGFVSPSGRYFAFATDSVYLYDAETEQLSCASCLSDGSPGGGTLSDSERFISNRVPQVIDDQGRLFFDTPARLISADVNGESDVYVFQDGKASLISPGNAPFEARFADMSVDGSDVFFTTNQKLVGQDNDNSPDIYDARIGGGLASQSPPPPQECLRDDCKATPNAGPELPFGGSEALNGPGNVKPQARKRCGKGRYVRAVKGKARCVKQHKAKRDRGQGR
jgi:hypothetical protein